VWNRIPRVMTLDYFTDASSQLHVQTFSFPG